MPKAAKSHITSSAPATETTTRDPALVVAYQINRLWDAYHGADCEALDLKHKGETTDASIVRDHANQIWQWRDALETVLSFTRATTLAGALFQMVIAAEDLDTLLSNLECRLSLAESEKNVDLSDNWLSRIEEWVEQGSAKLAARRDPA